MRRDLIFGTVFSAALAVTVSAQSTAQSAADQQDKSGSRDAAQTVTFTGCLRSADGAGSSAGAAGSSTSSPTASQSAATARGGFILTDVTSGPSAAASTRETTPENPTAGSPATPTGTSGTSTKSYRLTGSASNFSSLVGKRVEVKGTLQDRTSAGAGATAGADPAGSTTPPKTGSGMGDMTSMQQLRVTSVSEVPGTCPSEGR